MLNRKTEQKHVAVLVKEFYPVCENIANRADLIAFINGYLAHYPFLEELKAKLGNKDYIFNFQI